MDWKTSESRPGYIEKTLRHGSAPITVYRPVPSPQEQAPRHEATASAPRPTLAPYIRRIADRKE